MSTKYTDQTFNKIKNKTQFVYGIGFSKYRITFEGKHVDWKCYIKLANEKK